jgi:hypothetical protein
MTVRLTNEAASVVMRAADLEPLVVYPGSKTSWLCRCTICDREVTPTYSNVKKGGGCGWCAGQRVDLSEAVAMMRAADLEPLVVYPGAKTPWLCRCMICDREVTPRYNDVKQRRGGCGWCAKYGLDLGAPGIVYLIAHRQLDAAKIGISTTEAKQDRVAAHSNHGWDLVRRWDVATGAEALTIEQEAIGWWRNQCDAPVALTADDMPTGGYTETASLVLVDVDDTIRFINKLAA